MIFLLTIAGTALLTTLLLLFLLNLRAPEARINHRIECSYPPDHPHFLHIMSNLLGPPILRGNRITPLVNGEEIFPAMLRAIAAAEKTITFETYIYWTGTIGRTFAEALAERARADVRVHVLLDFMGSQSLGPAQLSLMAEAGCEIEHFHPIRWYNLERLNHRTHRKILVVDGKIGFTGGVGIADEWTGNARNPDEWRDSHFKIEGPVVAQLQAAFTDNWMRTHARVLHEEQYFPQLQPEGETIAQVFKSSPQQGSVSARLMFMLSLAAARKRILLANSYFVPDELGLQALCDAAERGVRVQIIVPGPHIDVRIVRRASRAFWGRLLRAGVDIHEYLPTMYHCKLLVVDEHWVSVGSANFDQRSFQLNDEANLNVLNHGFAQEIAAQFHEDLKHCQAISLEAWERRPWREKLLEHAASLLRNQL